MVYPITKMVLGPLFRVFIKKVTGLEHVPKKGAFIIAMNHASYLDPILVADILVPHLDRGIHYLALKNKNWDFFGDTITQKWAGCIPLTEDKKKAYQEMLNWLKKGEIVGMFPEGNHTKDGKIKKAKLGVAKVAIESGAPILPIGLIGTFEIAPGNKIIPRMKRATIHIGKPFKLKAKDLNKEILEQETRLIMKKIAALAHQEYPF